MSTSSTSSSSSAFKGSSAFSSDFSALITRAVGIASLPIQTLQNTQTTLSNQQSALQGLSTQFQSLQSALDSVNSAVGNGLYSALVDASSVASAAVSSGAMGGTYAVAIGSIGSRTNTMSKGGLTTVSDPSAGNLDSGVTAYTLTVNSTPYQISNNSGTLNGLVQAINASGAAVQATIVDIGSSSQHDYRLSIQSTNYAPDSIQLNDGTTDLLNTIGNPGTYVTYQVNGQPSTPINSTSRSLNISTGLTVNALQTGSVNVTVSQSTTAVSNALSSFTNTYNTVVDALAKQRGQNGGALAGQSIVFELQSALRDIGSYSASSGTLSSMSDFGLTFDKDGHLNLDSSVLSSAGAANVLSFLGSESTSGFLKSANDILTGVTNSTSGLLPQASTSLTSELSDIASQISKKQEQVTQLGQTLTAQMAAADATISSLEQQLAQVQNLFTAMQDTTKALYG